MATAIITGSARGIGAAIAFRLAKDGYDIALNDIAESCFENNDIIDKIKAEGVKCEKYIADVSKYDQCEAFVKSVKADFGSIDVLVNNAGITRDGLLVRMSEENYDLVVAVKRIQYDKVCRLCYDETAQRQDYQPCKCSRSLRQPRSDELLRYKGGYNRYDKDHSKGTWSEKHHL